MSAKVHISVVSPVYKAEMIVPELIKQLKANLSLISENYEIILINDSSPDGSWLVIQNECDRDERVKGINLSRNFGQHNAITAGLDYASGDWVVVMDCDLQDRPDEIPNLYKKAQEGFQSVFAQRVKRQDKFIKKLTSKLFYKFFGYLTDTIQDATVANFGIYHRSVINAILSMKDHVRYFPTMVQWVGYNKAYLPVKHSDRYEGETSYNLSKLTKLAIDNIISFSDKPLRLTVKLGFFMSIIALVVGVVTLIGYFSGNISVSGYTSLIISIWFSTGVIILLLGVIGLYIGKSFEKVKNRPTFLIMDKVNL